MDIEKTTEEKIDFIYNHIKTERKFIFGRRMVKILMYLFFIGYIIYFYMYGFEKLKNSVITSLKPEISTEKIVDSLKDGGGDLLKKTKGLLKNQLNSQDSGINTVIESESF